MHIRPMHRLFGILAAATMLTSAVALAQQIIVEPPPGGGVNVAPPPATAPSSAPTNTPVTVPAATAPTTPTAESVLQGLLRDNGGTGNASGKPAVITPQEPAAAGPALGPDGLLREGEWLVKRHGRLVKQNDGAFLFVFDSGEIPAYPPMPVVPSRRLAALEDAVKGADVTLPPITGEVTQYRGKNYLYIQSFDEPLRSVISPGATPVPATAPAPPPVQAAPAAPNVDHHPEGTLIISRTGRLVRDGKTGAQLIVLDSDGKHMDDPPMGVVPCKMLAVMEDATQNGAKSMKFKISGEVTLYRGRNYLYLKAITAVIDLHQGIAPGLGGE
jgi:hypothetical protein